MGPSQDLSPIGSAGHYRGYLLVELPLPWPSDVSQVAELAEVTGLADQAGLRLQAIAPAGGAVEGPPAHLLRRLAARVGGAAIAPGTLG